MINNKKCLIKKYLIKNETSNGLSPAIQNGGMDLEGAEQLQWKTTNLLM